eukprot:TRINITY_DN17474_c0_g1_i1.p1 TRINITY_DN17474_c0_g1~~TRINITY_DN17474_c0_g1_i1.p1  ORF type:complete len:311 (+),score=53.98 TRINITY_DN17474_c0_g1_i1:116-1048(+)
MTSTCAGLPRDDAPCRRILRASNHYAVIGVAPSASDTEIKAEYRRRAREVHPDKNASPLASESFKRLQKASEILSDPSKKRRYDVTGDDNDDPPPRSQSYRRGYDYEYRRYENRQPDAGMLLAGFFVPAVLSMLLALALALLSSSGDAFGRKFSNAERSGKAEVEEFPEFTAADFDKHCGTNSKQLCVLLLTKPSKGAGKRERDLLKDLRADAATAVRTSRGQSLPMTWGTVRAVGDWPSLLPRGASLPWFVVMKQSRAGPRIAALPVPKAGGKSKGRLREGLPKMLQSIATGSAKFEPLQGAASRLFRR